MLRARLPAGADMRHERRNRRVHLVAELAGDPLFGLHAAAAIRPGAFDVLDYAVRTAPDLRSALQRQVDASVAAGAEVLVGGNAVWSRYRQYPVFGLRWLLGRSLLFCGVIAVVAVLALFGHEVGLCLYRCGQDFFMIVEDEFG